MKLSLTGPAAGLVANGKSNLRPTRRGSQVEAGLEVSRLRFEENFDRFNFAFYKEKEMADFRRWILALAVMAVFVSLASAQVGIGGTNSFLPFTCGLQNTVTPQLRSEGYAEQTGDIVIVCTGGTPLQPGTAIPTVDIAVFYSVPAVTSRLLSTSTGASEAVLLIDEPDNGLNSSLFGYGPSLPQMLCGNATQGAGPNGCPEWVGTVNGNAGVPVSGSSTGTTPGANVFQGIVSGAEVQFLGIPVLPPVSSGISRVFRITNVRVNANGAGGSAAGGPGQVNASISISGATSLGLTNANPVVGFISQSLKTAVANAGTFAQCNATTGFSGYLQFAEQFPTAFKTRVDGGKGGASFNATGTGMAQNVPGVAYQSESNFVLNGQNQTNGFSNGYGSTLTGGGFTAGLADYGTRLKAIFSNVPTGVSVYVSTTNVTGTNVNNYSQVGLGLTNFDGGTASPFTNSTATSYAVLLTSENASDGTGSVPVATATTSFTTPSGANPPNVVQYTSQGTPIVVEWEVINTQPTVQETIQFAVFVGYSNVTQTFPPAPSTGQVNLTYAPTPTNGAFSATSGGTTAVNNQIPRFVDNSTASTFFTINQCSTTLLFPYVTTVPGFDTGLVIANTTTDPFKTVNQQGTCALNWYNTGGPNPAQTITPLIPTGNIFVQNASVTTNAGPNFSGYMIAVCNFQLAHGVAEVMDVGLQHLLSAYLALVLPTGTGARTASGVTLPEQLNN